MPVGSDLYIIPGIDMVNHSTDPSQINTSLHRRELPTGTQAAAEDANENGGPLESFFTLEAGAQLIYINHGFVLKVLKKGIIVSQVFC